MDVHSLLLTLISICYYVVGKQDIRFCVDNILISASIAGNQTTSNGNQTIPQSQVEEQQPSQYKSSGYIVIPSHGTNSTTVTFPITTTNHFTREFFPNRISSGHITFVNNPLRTLSVLEPLEIGGCEKRKRVTVLESSQQKKCLVSVNAGFYVPETNECLGNIVSDGRLVKKSLETRNPNFGIRKDGSLVFGYLSEVEIENTTNPFVQLISGVGWLLKNGEVYVDESQMIEGDSEWSGIFESTSGRTIIGCDVAGRIILAQVDGKTHVNGVTLKSMANFLKEIGVVNAINLDGGGSTTYVINGTIVNSPTDLCPDPHYNCVRPVSTIVCAHEPDCLTKNSNHDTYDDHGYSTGHGGRGYPTGYGGAHDQYVLFLVAVIVSLSILRKELPKILIICACCLLMCGSTTASVTNPTTAATRKVLLISLDGFRADYLDKTNLPNFNRLISDGVRAAFTVSSFITKTLTNHYSMATGMHQESHGILGNYMYDPVWNEHFQKGQPSSLDAKWWNSAEPIWITNQNNLGKSAVINWPGSYINIRNKYPTYHLHQYNESIPYRSQIDWVIKHFRDDGINLGMIYFHEPDTTGHRHGPDSSEVIEVLQSLDNDVGYLIDQMERHKLYDSTNIIVTSDHGMAEVSVDRVIELDNYISSSLYVVDNNNPIMGIWPKDDKQETEIYCILKNISENMDVYMKDEIPSRFHYSTNRRVAPIVLVAKEGWMIFQNFTAAFPNREDTKYFKGEHGFDNRFDTMHAIFVARGPHFNKDQHVADSFHNVDIYPLLCHILDIPESPNNGSITRISHILKLN